MVDKKNVRGLELLNNGKLNTEKTWFSNGINIKNRNNYIS